MARTAKDAPLDVRPVPDWAIPWAPQDRRVLGQQRRRQRRQDKQVIRTTRDWSSYTHPRHPFDPYSLPSW